jgi:hypothetical protein
MGKLEREKVQHQLGIQSVYNTLQQHNYRQWTLHASKTQTGSWIISQNKQGREREAKRKKEDLDDPEYGAGKF